MTIQLITISGPTCGGKSTLEKVLRDSGHVVPVVSTTTRAPRPGEVQGKDYRFVTRVEFRQYLYRNMMLEWDKVSDEMYGTERAEIQRLADEGRSAVAVVTPHGADAYADYAKKAGLNHLRVYVSADTEELMRRLFERFRHDRADRAEAYASRAVHLMQEQMRWQERNRYDMVVQNCSTSDLQDAASQILDIGEAQRLRRVH